MVWITAGKSMYKLTALFLITLALAMLSSCAVRTVGISKKDVNTETSIINPASRFWIVKGGNLR